MAETLISPGVLARENDQSFVGGRPVTYGAAIIGPAVKGPVGIPTAVSSFSQYESIFGSTVESGSQYYSYLNSIAARNYFSQGGEGLLITRVVTGSFSGAVTSGSAEGVNNSGIDAIDIGVNVTLAYEKQSIGDTYFTIATDGSDTYVKTNGNYPQASNLVYVSAVNTPTPGYFDNDGTAKNIFTGSLPAIGSGSFTDATGNNFENNTALFNENITADDIQGIGANDYTQSIALLNNTDLYDFNVIAAPGLIKSLHSSQVTSLVSLAQNRTDCIAVVDIVPYDSTINAAVTQASGFDSSYAATYWPWLQTVDPGSGQTVWAPPSTYIPGVYAFTDASSDPWFAPAGLIRGSLGNVVRAERALTSGNRDTLYVANVNPIATFPGNGIVVFGQKTLQKRASALDRVNVRRLLIALKSYISQVSDNLVFEQNTISTRNNFLSQVNPYLESVQQRQGLYAFKVVMDETNNTPDVIDRNQLVGQIFLQPTKTAEFIILDFNVLPTGATFPD